MMYEYDSMDAARIIAYFKGKSILITGSTGFLGKILVEKILRVQPDATKIYLLVRGKDASSAKQRVQEEVIGTELFGKLSEKHGDGFQQFIQEKIVALPGDIIYDNLGLNTLEALAKDIDIIVNIAATTNFYERYDVSLDVNVMGVKHLCHFAQQCANLKMFMHVSTAYVCGDRDGLHLEKPIKPGESLCEGRYLDVDAELQLVREAKKELMDASDDERKKTERKAMKELGIQRARHFGWSNTYVFTKAMGEMLLGQLRGDMPVVVMRPSVITSVRADPLPGWMQGMRTIDTLIIGYAKQNLSCFLGDLSVVVDVIPGDMVANAMMAHSKEKAAEAVPVYHVTSSLRNPVSYSVLYESGRRHFYQNPRVGKDGKVIPTREMRFFPTIAQFYLYMLFTFKLPLEILHLVNLLLCGLFSWLYNDLNRKYKFVMHLLDVYGPFAFFNGCFDDMNLERLRLTMVMKTPEDHMFNFDPKTIDWDHYFTRIHIPGVLKYLCK
ncbi:fatty acyl-CoA reductase 1-like [Miscanthus floridulus]|uniref:fatty acyl-CoA reductase 1-like n=1 Tax=Miscanthus floridulus TaxID=154761 RepID=UPI0034597735